MNTPNLALGLPGMPSAGDEPDAFIRRIAAMNLFRKYAEVIDAPVRTGVEVTRLAAAADGFTIETSLGHMQARNVVLATGAYQAPKLPAVAGNLPQNVFQLHTHEPRPPPQQLPDGAVLIVGTG